MSKQRSLFDDEINSEECQVTGTLNSLTPCIYLNGVILDPNKKNTANILALDVATNTGFCTSTTSGVWNLTPKKDESKNMRLIRFKGKLKEVCKIEDIKIIVFEQMAVYSKFPNFVGAEMIGVLKLFCEENEIEYKSYAPTVIKKFGTGKGNSKKSAMIEAAKKYKKDITSDDEADAIILYHLALNDLELI